MHWKINNNILLLLRSKHKQNRRRISVVASFGWMRFMKQLNDVFGLHTLQRRFNSEQNADEETNRNNRKKRNRHEKSHVSIWVVLKLGFPAMLIISNWFSVFSFFLFVFGNSRNCKILAEILQLSAVLDQLVTIVSFIEITPNSSLWWKLVWKWINWNWD